VIVASDLGRARETAETVASLVGLDVRIDARLRETSMGRWEGITRDEVIAGWAQEWNDWRTTSAHASPPGGESRWQVARRASAVVEELDADSVSRALLVSHGGTIVGLTGRLLDVPEGTWGTLIGVGNCHWVVLHRYAGAWRLHSYNAGLGGLVLPRGEDQVAGT
jgi:2,3-bisphosphoglycerate-dependent phosphoglycerate mutase/probable phosphoglycerate mutase